MPSQPPINYQSMPKIPNSPGLPSSTGPKRSSIRVIITIIILFFLVGGAVYYFFVYPNDSVENTNLSVAVNNTNSEFNTNLSNSNTQNGNADGSSANKYENNDYNYSFIYPVTYVLKTSNVEIFDATNVQLYPTEDCLTRISQQPGLPSDCFTMYIKIYHSSLSSEEIGTLGRSNIIKKDIKVGEKDASKTSFTEVRGENDPFKSIIVSLTDGFENPAGEGSVYYSFVIVYGGDSEEEALQSFNQLIETFTIIDDIATSGLTNSSLAINTNIPANQNTNLVVSPSCDLGIDPDCDKLTSTRESSYGTTEGVADTDGDGFSDFTEVSGCYNPLGEGRMGLKDYSSYCFKVLQQSFGIVYGADDDILISMCELWEPIAQQIIDGHISNSDIDEIINNYIESEIYKVNCNQLDSLTSEDVGISGSNVQCLIMQIMIDGFCHES